MHFKSSGQISQALAFFKSLNGYGSLEFSTEFSSCSLHWFDLFLSEYTNLTNGPIIGEYYILTEILYLADSTLFKNWYTDFSTLLEQYAKQKEGDDTIRIKSDFREELKRSWGKFDDSAYWRCRPYVQGHDNFRAIFM